MANEIAMEFMIRSYYTAASGMIYENKRQENIAQNLSNIETNGFKQTMLMATSQSEATVRNQNGRHEVGSLTMKVGIHEANLSMEQGALKVTNNPLDFAIQGSGFFVLEGPNGLVYTRDGSFGVNNQGLLVSKEGYPVLSQQGYVQVGEGEVGSTADGRLSVNGMNYQLQIMNLEDVTLMTPLSNNTYAYAGEPVLSNEFMLNQGMVEGSNVDATTELVKMIESSRSFQMNSKVLQAMDQVMAQSVSEIGKI